MNDEKRMVKNMDDMADIGAAYLYFSLFVRGKAPLHGSFLLGEIWYLYCIGLMQLDEVKK